MVDDKDTIVSNDSFLVVINGRSVAISKDMLSAGGELTFDQILELAQLSQPPSYIISYRESAERPPDGKITASGQKVKVQEGTVFIATPAKES